MEMIFFNPVFPSIIIFTAGYISPASLYQIIPAWSCLFLKKGFQVTGFVVALPKAKAGGTYKYTPAKSCSEFF